jgi:4-oxalomesaconate tautomerase
MITWLTKSCTARGDADRPAKVKRSILLRIMGSPDSRQIDGDPLTSKVAVVSPNDDGVDYLFLQVSVDQASVTDKQNCGNLRAGVGPFAIERGVVQVHDGHTAVQIRMTNTGGRATAYVPTPDGSVEYAGDTRIDGVPGTAAAILLDFDETAGSSCGALLPTGSVRDEFAGVPVTCVDNGMPTVVMRGTDLGLRGDETPVELESDGPLRDLVEAVRLEAGKRMNLGDVLTLTVPKMTIVSPPRNGRVLSTQTFIPHRVHASIGVLGAASSRRQRRCPAASPPTSRCYPAGRGCRSNIRREPSRSRWSSTAPTCAAPRSCEPLESCSTAMCFRGHDPVTRGHGRLALTLLVLCGCMAAYGMAAGTVQPLTMSWVTLVTPRRDRGMAASLRLVGNRAGQTGIPLGVAGLSVVGGAGLVFAASGGSLLVSAWLRAVRQNMIRPSDPGE